MTTPLTIAIVAAVLALLISAWVLWRDPRSISSPLFAVGMLLFGLQCVSSALSLQAGLRTDAIYYQRWSALALALVPAVWLGFSLTYSRGNYREFLWRWRLPLGAAVAVPGLVFLTPLSKTLVGINTGFSADDIEVRALASGLKGGSREVDTWLWGRLSPATQAGLEETAASQSEDLPEGLHERLVNELNQIIDGGTVYEEERFAGVDLSEKTQGRLKQDPAGNDLDRLNLNCGLLEDAYPGVLLKDSVATEYWQFEFGLAGVAIRILVLIGSVLVLMNLERTLRAAVGTQRWRLKLVVLGVGVLFGVRIYTSSQVLLHGSTDPFLDSLNAGGLLVACALIALSMVRTQVFAVEVYPSHAFLQGSLTVLLAGTYLLTVGLFAKVVDLLGGTTAFPVKSLFILVSLVVLTLILMSDRIRHFTERFVSQHLRRPRYDYRHVWRTFTEHTARQINEAEFCETAVKWVSETFNVLTVGIWLVDPSQRHFRLVASTGITHAPESAGAAVDVDEAVLIEVLRGRSEPFDIDEVQEKWADVLRRFNPDYFRKGGGRITVPLNPGGELLGLMTLGDRISGVPFSLEDFELLRSVGDQTANSLLNIQLSRRLLETREMEAFQTMSTFFVHDLKNVASTLSLMLRNLPIHFENPEFRQDALKGIGRSVDRINDLIGRLSELRRGLELHPTETDLNSLVDTTLGLIDPARRPRIKVEHGPQMRLCLDSEQIQKVLTNLLLNALEAIGPEGQIQVRTTANSDWVTVAVTDNGCGISREFLEKSLFRPFQTTKKRGIGIGMYQSRKIVEAHGGRIEAESEEGKGSTFRLSLPRRASINPAA